MADERCGWVTADPLYLEYHDKEWGTPTTDARELFEMLCLEGQQAGLSWITVLKKRENYRRAFHGFDPQRVAAMTTEDVENLLQDSGIIRHRGKIEAIITNAKAYLAMEAAGEDFVAFIWDFVGGRPQLNRWQALNQVPAKTEQSDAMSKALKKRGFKFIGSTICYAFMQASGLVNDHLTGVHLLPKVTVIRPCGPEDIERLMALWLPSTIAAHPFVAEKYWRESAALVRENYLPRAQSWACWHHDEIVGFISVLDEQFIGALFVDRAFHGRGVAQALMTHVQQRYRRLSLEVYQQNLRACAFYHKHGFQVTQRLFNEETQAYTLIMNWSAVENSTH